MGYSIFNISVEEFYKLFLADDSPFNYIEFLKEKGNKNCQSNPWVEPPEQYKRGFEKEVLKY